MFPEPLLSKHSASLTRTITLISEVRGREARPHKWSVKQSWLLSSLEVGTLVGIPGWGCLFLTDDGGKRRKVVRLFLPIRPAFSVPTVEDSL